MCHVCHASSRIDRLHTRRNVLARVAASFARERQRDSSSAIHRPRHRRRPAFIQPHASLVIPSHHLSQRAHRVVPEHVDHEPNRARRSRRRDARARVHAPRVAIFLPERARADRVRQRRVHRASNRTQRARVLHHERRSERARGDIVKSFLNQLRMSTRFRQSRVDDDARVRIERRTEAYEASFCAARTMSGCAARGNAAMGARARMERQTLTRELRVAVGPSSTPPVRWRARTMQTNAWMRSAARRARQRTRAMRRASRERARKCFGAVWTARARARLAQRVTVRVRAMCDACVMRCAMCDA